MVETDRGDGPGGGLAFAFGGRGIDGPALEVGDVGDGGVTGIEGVDGGFEFVAGVAGERNRIANAAI